jgi:gamma-glutamyl-gamma-aminobutyrate hydrolase PuuD
MIIGISQNVICGEFRNSDGLEHDYYTLFSSLGVQLLPFPNQPLEINTYLEQFSPKRIILSGGNDIIPNNNSEISTDCKTKIIQRGETESKLLEYAMKNDVPVLGICRGMQYINMYFKGNLHCDLEGEIDILNHIASTHDLKIVDSEAKIFFGDSYNVNSFHNQGIKKGDLAKRLKSFAETSDGVIEGIYHPTYPIVGIQWHPERINSDVNKDKQLMQAFLNRGLYWEKK